MTKLNNIINQLLNEFSGGETYFDKLDETLRSPENLDIIINLFSPLSDAHVIMSGKFGYYALELFDKGLIPLKSLIVVNGGLRKGEVEKIDVRFMEDQVGYVFVDDSFYKGRTRDKVEEFLKIFNCFLAQTRVIYDGSPEKDKNVFSMYRYHI